MAKRLSRSNEELPLEELYLYKIDAEQGLNKLFAEPENKESLLFLTPGEVQELLSKRIKELELQASLTLFTSVEAMFQIDFHNRVEKRAKDKLSRAFRELKQKRSNRISFENDILSLWEVVYPQTSRYFQPIRLVLKYRHWLAHGRYWLLQSPTMNFEELYNLAETLRNTLEEQKY